MVPEFKCIYFNGNKRSSFVCLCACVSVETHFNFSVIWCQVLDDPSEDHLYMGTLWPDSEPSERHTQRVTQSCIKQS